VDAEGTVVFLKSLQSGPKEAASVVSESPPAISSAFTPSYSLLLNLVSKHSLPQVKEILQRSFSDHVVTKDASQLDQKIKQCQKQKQLLEDKLFQELARENGSKLKEAAIFTRVDVRAQGCGKPWSHGVIPAVLLAVSAVIF
jgi:superfamily II RNA helicase